MTKEVPKKCHCCEDGDYISGSVYTSFPINNQVHPIHLSHRLPCPDTYKCNKCDHVYRHYEEDITEYHKSDNYRGEKGFSEDKKKFTISEELKKVRDQRWLNQLGIVRQFAKEDDSLVDLATGMGGFLEHAKKYYKNLTGTELHHTALTHNAETNPEVNIIISDILDMDDNVSYDCATAFDVLEHVDDIRSLVNKLHKIVNKYFIFQIPFNRTPYAPPNDLYHWTNDHMEGRFDGHVHFYTERSIESLFCKDGLFSLELMMLSGPGVLAGGQELMVVVKNNA
jgi:ubiquinone/menaquinone biosynthesis C-methylase UbiE